MQSSASHLCSPVMQSSKRRFEAIFSPLDLNISSSAKRFDKSLKVMTKKKLQFTFNSPVMQQKNKENDSPVMNPKLLFSLDDNSCDSGYSETGNSASLDDSLNEHSFLCDNLMASPLAQLNNLEIQSMTHFRTQSTKKTFKKAKSELFNESAIKQALDNIHHEEAIDKQRLIGDMSKCHSLPIMSSSKHNDLASITSHTLADVISGKYNDQIGEYMILDARYPYEFNGGHIGKAESAYIKEELFEKLFSKPLTSTNGKPVVLIFHCEFSSERGPKLMREIRERDRMINKLNYPCLSYPEMYLLEGGYKSFFEYFDDLCLPKSYLPMHHDNHRNDLKYFRSKSKSWDAETKKRLNKAKLTFE